MQESYDYFDVVGQTHYFSRPYNYRVINRFNFLQYHVEGKPKNKNLFKIKWENHMIILMSLDEPTTFLDPTII